MTPQEAENKLTILAAMETNWDSYGAPPIPSEVISAGRVLIAQCFALGYPPDRIHGGDGVAVYFTGRGRRYADIEICENGEILCCTSTGHVDGITVFPVQDLNEAIARVYDFAKNSLDDSH